MGCNITPFQGFEKLLLLNLTALTLCAGRPPGRSASRVPDAHEHPCLLTGCIAQNQWGIGITALLFLLEHRAIRPFSGVHKWQVQEKSG